MCNQSFKPWWGFLLLSPVLLCLGSCGGVESVTQAPFTVSPELVTGKSSLAAQPSQEVRIDVYLDATTSMKGFAAPPQSVYDKFIQDIDAITKVGWVSGEVRYYKFGLVDRQINRQEFLTARDPRDFYSEPGIFPATNIDLVLSHIDSLNVSLVVTDLFQQEQDVNAIVAQIKERCLLRNIEVALLGVLSQYAGKVFDANVPPYDYTSSENKIETYRPFYVLMFGDPSNLERCFEFLCANSYIDEHLFVSLAPHLQKQFSVKVVKSRDSKGLGKYRSEKDAFTYYFNLKRRNPPESLEVEIPYTRNVRTPDFDTDKLKFVVYRKQYQPRPKAWSADSVLCTDITLSKLERTDATMHASLRVEVPEEKGNYAYFCGLQVSSVNSLIVPDWVKEWSSDNPTSTSSSNKTLNLEKFITNLLRARVTIAQPYVAYFVVKLRRI